MESTPAHVSSRKLGFVLHGNAGAHLLPAQGSWLRSPPALSLNDPERCPAKSRTSTFLKFSTVSATSDQNGHLLLRWLNTEILLRSPWQSFGLLFSSLRPGRRGAGNPAQQAMQFQGDPSGLS